MILTVPRLIEMLKSIELRRFLNILISNRIASSGVSYQESNLPVDYVDEAAAIADGLTNGKTFRIGTALHVVVNA
jgi:hypothetical protein